MHSVTTTRPAAASVLAALQTVIAIVNIVALVVVWIALRSPEVAQGPHASEDVHNMQLSVAVLAAGVVLTCVAAVGLWKRWVAGWVLSLALALTVVLGILWGPVFDHDHMEGDDVAVTATFALIIVVALLPPVRRWYMGARSATTLRGDRVQLKSGY